LIAYSFHEGLPKGLNVDFDLGIFHDPKHLTLQAPSGWVTFLVTNDPHTKIYGVLYVYLNQGEAKSPARSPFGSFLFAEQLSDETVKKFIRFVEAELRQRKVQSFTIKHQPERYSALNAQLQRCLREEEYDQALAETSAIISVTEKSFEQNLHRSEKKKLRKCSAQNFMFEIVPGTQLEKVYAFLEACREEKGYALSMSLKELQQLVKTLPERLLLTLVTDKNKIIAANISIRVYDHVLYNFYHDHASEYDLVSPVVFLNEGLYNFCRQQKIQLLDLGTSNPNGVLNESLLTFKLRLGALPSPKITFSKRFV
jgi:predicted N-acyltransferase